MHCGVIILGAGASSRMGRSKLLLPWGRTSIIGRLLEQWRELKADQIVVVRRAGDAALDSELDRLGLPREDRIANPHPEQGMFSSIQCGACWKGWREVLEAWVIVLGDQPHLRPATLQALLEFHRGHPDAICQPAYGGHARHPVLLPRAAFDPLRQSRAETLRAFLRQEDCPVAECPIDDPGLAFDLDQPADYDLALKLYASGS